MKTRAGGGGFSYFFLHGSRRAAYGISGGTE